MIELSLVVLQGAQAYFCGHEHNLQLLRMDNGTTHYVISGAGSRSNYSDDSWNPEGNLFHHMGSGENNERHFLRIQRKNNAFVGAIESYVLPRRFCVMHSYYSAACL